jgi:hypothetical protein
MKIALDSEDGMPLEAESDESETQEAFVYSGPSSESRQPRKRECKM